MINFASRLRRLFGGLVTLAGASLVAWQAVLVYYLLTGRVQAGAEHPPLALTVAILIVGCFLAGAGRVISRPAAVDSK